MPTDLDPAAQAAAPPLWLLAMITLSGTLAMHIFVPALPHAAADLGAGVPAMQLTISLYIFGLAIGQLIYGPLSDRYGRRPLLLGGLALYTLASIAGALAAAVDLLIPLRLFQALGGCAGLVLGRAIIRDTVGAAGSARLIALLNMMVTLGPAIGPVVGGALASTLGWRSIFVLLTGLGLANLAFAWRGIRETASPQPGTSAATVARNYGRLLRSGRFIAFAIGGGCATTSMYAFISAAPFIFMNQLHRPAYEVGLYLALMVSGVWLGSVVTTRLVMRVPVARLMVRGNMVSLVAAAVLLAAVLAGQLSVPLIVATMFVLTFGVAIAGPTAASLAISVSPEVIGSASGLYGFTQMTLGALCTAAAGIGGNPALAAALVLTVAGVLAQVLFWYSQRRAAQI